MRLTSIPFSEMIMGEKRINPEEERMRKVKYVKPGVVGGSSVHPC